MPPPRPGTRWVTDFFSYETTKSVVVKSWVVGAVNRGVQLLILAYFVGWVFLHEKAYQVRDTVIESSVVTKVKGIGRYAGRVLDTADYVTPHQGTSVFVVVTKQILTENQAQGVCPEVRGGAGGGADGALRPLQRDPAHLRDPGLVPARGGHRGRTRHAGGRELHPLHQEQHPLPALRLREGQPAAPRQRGGAGAVPVPPRAAAPLPHPAPGGRGAHGRAGLPHAGRHRGGCWASRSGGCVTWTAPGSAACPATPSPPPWTAAPAPPAPAPGYNFRHARYYRWQDGTERRTLTKAFGIRFDVLVYGNAGKFGIVPTLINTVAAFTSIGVGTVLCDIILLNFLKGAEHYKARKFEEVPEVGVPAPPVSPTACRPTALGGCSRDKHSTDSGTFSLGL
ncbi:unnamed protein product [Bubo scandiacus]